MYKKHNERGAGRKPLLGKVRHLKLTDEELTEIKQLLKEIRKTKTHDKN